jgi:hypothetical protein
MLCLVFWNYNFVWIKLYAGISKPVGRIKSIIAGQKKTRTAKILAL